jgi:hypothetical protein
LKGIVYVFVKIDVRSMADGKIDKSIDVILYLIERYRHPAIRKPCYLFSNKVPDHACHLSSQA